MHMPGNFKLRAVAHERESSHRDALSTAYWNTGKDAIYYRFHILVLIIMLMALMFMADLCYIFIYIIK